MEVILKGAAEKVSTITNVIGAAESSEQLLLLLLDMLVKQGFSKSALLVVSCEDSECLVIAARGKGVSVGERFTIDNPLSPILQKRSKVQSAKGTNSHVSPFGSATFAVAPVEADHPTTVCLYADCGTDEVISFELRRVFRYVMKVVNAQMPLLACGLPIEIVPVDENKLSKH